MHKEFGIGTVMAADRKPFGTIVTVEFQESGTKRLKAEVAQPQLLALPADGD
jgi:hypothetical protein